MGHLARDVVGQDKDEQSRLNEAELGGTQQAFPLEGQKTQRTKPSEGTHSAESSGWEKPSDNHAQELQVFVFVCVFFP